MVFLDYFSEDDGIDDDRYDGVAVGPLLLPAGVAGRSHSTYGSSAQSDSHRVFFLS